MRAFIFVALLGSVLAIPEQTTRIVGGSTTVINRYPYMSNMQYGVWGIWWYQACGGTLLTTTVVVSAAHCYSGDSASSWRVRLGTSLRSSGGSVHSVSQLLLNSGFNSKTMVNDVAIVRLRTPAVLSNLIQTARIAGANYNVAVGAAVNAIGWGKLQSGGSTPDQLQHVAINVINQKTCADRYAFLKTVPGFSSWPDVTSGMICAGILNVGGKDTCQGDSGGPLIHQSDILVGITSWGYGCAHAYYPGVSTRVSSYSNWIVNNA